MGTVDSGPSDPDPSLADRHQRANYRLLKTIAKGGQAEVFRATHKVHETAWAFKRLHAKGVHEDDVARMRREVEAARRFGGHPNVMPIQDWDLDHRWFVMPLAEGTAQGFADDLTDSERLRELVTAVCAALRRPHEEGWIHRDLKPDNILRLDGRWVVADWGLGRRPHGQSSNPRRTQTGTMLGTVGFAAPELSVDAHDVGPQADVYSIGQLIGWALTGRHPRANIPLLPPQGPWSVVVEHATRYDATDRPATVDALLALVDDQLDGPAEPLVVRGRRLLAADDRATSRRLVELAAEADADHDLFHEVVVEFTDFATVPPKALAEVVRAARTVSGHSDRLIAWVLAVARYAADAAEWGLLGVAAESLFAMGGAWRSDIREWSGSLSGEAAATVAAARRGIRSRTRKRQLAWSAVGLSAAVVTVAVVLATNDRTTPDPEQPASESRTPSQLAATPQLKNFVVSWDGYPNWATCRLATGDAALTGSFPAAVIEPHAPTHAITCDNGGSLTVMFAEHLAGPWYQTVADRYRSAPAPARPVDKEKSPPADVHVFQWSSTQRALVWTDDNAHTIGVMTTDSSSVDLVTVWSRYRG
jgi:tRNA A-37 threonylcarbamoyl transferase component Bud32